MIKVLHVVTRLNMGGLTTFLHNYYKFIDRSKVQFDVVAIDTGERHSYHDKFEDLGGKVYYMPDKLLSRALYFTKLVKQNQYQIVHAHIEVQSAIYLILAKLVGVKVLISHAHWSKDNVGFKNTVLRFLLNNIVTLRAGASKLAIEAVVGKKYLSLGKVIRNAVDLDVFNYDIENRKKYRKAFNLNEKFVIGFVGRLTYQKNIPFLVSIFDKLISKEPNAVLMIVGGGEDAKLIKEKIDRGGWQNNVMWIQESSEINNLMNVMDVMLLPSHFEGLPLVLVEAQATSLMCYVSDAITKQVELTKYIKYLSIEVGNEDLWVESILATGKSYTRISTKQELTNAHFNIKEEANNLLILYNQLLNGESND